jgi:inward rectifier potassium channel
MGDLGQTRVFGRAGQETVVVGFRRKPLSDLYHRLVTGGWLQLTLVFMVVYFVTRAGFEVAHWSLQDAADVAPGSLMQAFMAWVDGAGAGAAPVDARALLARAVFGLEGFVRWAELVIGAGIVMAKFSMQKALVLFSDVAVIAPHGRGPAKALLFRMANKRGGHVVDARMSLLLVRNEKDADGELVRRAHDLPLVRAETPLFEHAWTVAHEIDRQSPLWGESAESLAAADGELLVTFSGTDEHLLKAIHARHVYPAKRLRWGAMFAPIATVLPDGRRALDYRRFHEVVHAEPDTEEALQGRTGART